METIEKTLGVEEKPVLSGIPGGKARVGTMKTQSATEGWQEELKAGLRDSASTLLDRAQETASNVTRRAQDIATQATENTETAIRRYPLQSLAVGFGIGVLIGLLIPSRK